MVNYFESPTYERDFIAGMCIDLFNVNDVFADPEILLERWENIPRDYIVSTEITEKGSIHSEIVVWIINITCSGRPKKRHPAKIIKYYRDGHVRGAIIFDYKNKLTVKYSSEFFKEEEKSILDILQSSKMPGRVINYKVLNDLENGLFSRI